MSGPNVFACSRTDPITVCADAGLQDGGNLLYPDGNASGQAGWDVGVNYANCEDLARQLVGVKAKRGAVSRLAVSSHGYPGELDIDGVLPRTQVIKEKEQLGVDNPRVLTVGSFAQFQARLMPIAACVEPGAVVLLMGCLAGGGAAGTELLKLLSRSVFPGRKVVAFTTVGVAIRQYRRGEGCSNPGMRDTPHESNASTPDLEEKRYPTDVLLKLPWASEGSPHAKVVQDGKVLKDPDAVPTKGARDLCIPWFVEIDGLRGPTDTPAWTGVFSFTNDGKVFWAANMGAPRHYGRWRSADGKITWEFDDDAPAFKRTFTIPSQWSGFSVRGLILPAGRGAFKMTDRT
jgi:hypothetical protein